ncbi:GNAT family N-acetyltransferase [Pedobacter sp. ASV1-7]|uniref:GNAT family N-acetyltransferase n=1 Tax=Pedobacter sp. ASV1-7 TaxID=3145237 RepID=UPI0032E92C76
MSYLQNNLLKAKYKIITEPDNWAEYLKKSVSYDVYHTFHYYRLDKRGGEPMLFVYEEGNTFIALPLLKREIEDVEFYDFTSSYGYTGPISNKSFDRLNKAFITQFCYSFGDFMQHNRAVSVFSRLNPFINQCELLDKIGGVRNNGRTVYIDLKQSLEEQRNRYDKRLYRQIRQLRKKDYLIKYADTRNEISLFTDLYNKNMLRLNADQSYFFDENYFNELLENTDFNCRLLLIYDGDKMICGATIMWSDGVIRNHLSATAESHIQFSPSKLLTDEISIIGRNLGMKYFHLGGGVGGREDTLFKFKLSFSNLLLEDKIWCYIADDQLYNQLVDEKNLNGNSTYFPLYRNL